MNDTNPRDERASRASGRFVLRIDPGLHAQLRKSAKEAGLSLNEYCARKLSSPGGDISGPFAEAVRRATSLLGADLLGVMVFGSWARDELSETSDIDLLIVVADARPIHRDLYASWDEAPLVWESHPLEPHFVDLPESGGRISGLWAEAALEGVVLLERGFVLSRRLVEVRRRIADGRLVRRSSHGHPYWVEVA
jgi:hypothetical protein